MKKLVLVFALILVVSVSGRPQNSGSQTVSTTLVQAATGQSNTQSVSGVAASVAKTIAAASGQRAHLYQVSAFCSAGTASVTITDGGTTIWSTPSTAVGTGLIAFSWTPVPLASSYNSAMVITLSSCGGGNTGTLNVQASQF